MWVQKGDRPQRRVCNLSAAEFSPPNLRGERGRIVIGICNEINHVRNASGSAQGKSEDRCGVPAKSSKYRRNFGDRACSEAWQRGFTARWIV